MIQVFGMDQGGGVLSTVKITNLCLYSVIFCRTANLQQLSEFRESIFLDFQTHQTLDSIAVFTK